ncbi:hypothetical protein Tco_1213458 [Tanacetum coccineum]
MARSEDDIPPPPPTPSQTPTQQTPHIVSTIKLPILKKGEYDINGLEMAGSHDFHENEKVLQKDRDCKNQGNQDSRRRDAWNSGNKDKENNGRRSGKQEDSKALVTIDGEGVDWTSHSEEEEDYALMACNSSGSDTESQPSESETQTSDFDTCESDCSVETHESLPEPTVNEPKVVSQPKVWSDAPIIEEYESDSKDEHVSLPTEEQETPSFANKQVKTPRETVKNQFTHSKNPKVDKKGLGYGCTTKACFVCGSLSHLIRDCDFHKKRMAKIAELNNRMINTARTNGTNTVYTARASGTNNVSTARHNFNSQAVLTNAARKISTVKPFMNKVRPKTIFHKTHSPFRRPFNNTTALKTTFTKQKVNTAGVNSVSVIGQNRETVVKTSAVCNWRTKRHYWNRVSKYNSGSRTNVYFRDLQGRLKSTMAWVPKRN